MPSYSFVQIQTRVSEEINDSSNANVTLTQVKKAIVSAVEHYERNRRWFAETISRTTLTVANAPAVAVPTDMVFLDRIQLAATTTFTGTTSNGTSTLTSCSNTAFPVGSPIIGTGIPNNTFIKSVDSATQITMGDIFGAAVNATASASITVRVANQPRRTLQPISYEKYSGYQNTVISTGEPTQYCYYQDRVFLYTIPNQVYLLTFWYDARLTTLSADADNNGWTNYAEPVIRNRAKWDIFSNLLRNIKLAQLAKAQELDALAELDAEGERRNTVGKTRARYL